jgi:4-aminobutyrate aminotransferase-like enzyme
MGPVGSEAVRRVLERHQPMLGLHGHIHESRGAVRLGRTLSINPGSEPAADEAGWMLDFCVREGLLFEKGGYYYNRFQLIPALAMEKELIDRAVGILDRAMSMAEARAGIPGGS